MANSPSLAKPGRSTAKFGDLRRRAMFLLLALIVYRIGAHIPVPGIDPDQLAKLFQSQAGGILGMFNMFSGGALSRFTIFALGIMPYISASIIMQLLAIVSPQLEALKKEGQAGQRKITQYTRYFTVVLATFQAFGIAAALENQPGLVTDPGMLFRLTTVVTLVTGTMFLMWLGEQITERGLGNGISIIIFGGIAAGFPNAVGGLFELVRTGSMSIISAIIIVVLIAAVTYLVVVHRTRSAQDPRELRETPGRQQDLRWAVVASAAEAEHVGCDSADLRIVDHSVPGNDSRLVQYRSADGKLDFQYVA